MIETTNEISASTDPVAKWRILVFPGGTEIGMEIWRALAWRKEVKLFSAGSNVSNHASYVFQNHFILPTIHEKGWIGKLNSLVAGLKIDFIFPAYDDVLLALAENSRQIHCRIVTSPPEICRIARSKSATYRYLRRHVPTPHIYKSPKEVTEFPVFLKPDAGQGSQRVRLACDPKDLKNAMDEFPDRIIVEYLPGEEYTVDCFSDRKQGLLFCSPRIRHRVKAGIATNSESVSLPEAGDIARKISSRLRFHGAWFFQLKRDRFGSLKILEVAPRIAGTSGVCRAMGINLPLLSLYEAERIAVNLPEPQGPVTLDRSFVNRCRRSLDYRTIYIDFDDTIIVCGRVNPDLVKFLFQALNRGVRLVLLTRHAEGLSDSLCKYRLQNLFDEVVSLGLHEPKSVAVRDPKAIFIDDSFRERDEVWRAKRIPVFDPSCIDALLDDRV